MRWWLVILGVLANAGASVLVKTSSGSPIDFSLQGLITSNWRLIGAVTLYGFAFIAYALALRSLPLNVAHPVSTAGAVVVVGLASAFFFHETFTVWRMIGYGVLVVGIAMLAFEPGLRT